MPKFPAQKSVTTVLIELVIDSSNLIFALVSTNFGVDQICVAQNQGIIDPMTHYRDMTSSGGFIGFGQKVLLYSHISVKR